MKNHERFDNFDDAIEAFEFERLGDERITNDGVTVAVDNFRKMVKWLYEGCEAPDDFKRTNNFTTYDNRRCENCAYRMWKTEYTDKSEREFLVCVKSIPFEVGKANVCDCWRRRTGE